MADEWSIDAHDAFRVAAELTAGGVQAAERAYGITRMYGQLLVTGVQARASGRPGPRAVTGDYRRSISQQSGLDAGGPWSEVGTDKPQGRRLEFGFNGADSLGRVFHQAPLPHFGPALDAVADPYGEAIAAVVDGI